MPLAQKFETAHAYPWQERIAEPLHRVSALEAAALARPVSEVLQTAAP